MNSPIKKTVLAHWVYTREEWVTFMRKENRRKSVLCRLVHWLGFGVLKTIPEVEITTDNISVGNRHHPFKSGANALRRINILDEGLINVMVIRYDSVGNRTIEPHEIRVPVPRGKLKEAILVQEKLLCKQD